MLLTSLSLSVTGLPGGENCEFSAFPFHSDILKCVNITTLYTSEALKECCKEKESIEIMNFFFFCYEEQ